MIPCGIGGSECVSQTQQLFWEANKSNDGNDAEERPDRELAVKDSTMEEQCPWRDVTIRLILEMRKWNAFKPPLRREDKTSMLLIADYSGQLIETSSFTEIRLPFLR